MFSQKNHLYKAPIWKEINFLIWVLPIAGYLTAISFDIGYLSYFNIPIFFAELNFYTAAASSFILFLLFLSGGFSLLSVAEFEEVEHWIFPTIFNAQIALGSIIVGIFLYFDEDWPVIGALWIYIFFNFARLYVIAQDKSSGLPFRERVRKFSFSSLNPSQSLSKSVLKQRVSVLLDFLMLLLGLFILAFMAGNSVAKLKSWRIEGHPNTIVVSRNNSLFIEKTYDHKTKVLKKGCKLIVPNEDNLLIVPVEPELRLRTPSI